MQKILSYLGSKEHYRADACIVWCFDNRFSGLLEAYIKDRKFTHVDLVKVAGGAKGLAAPKWDPDPSRRKLAEAERTYLLDQIAKSIKLHHTQDIVLMAHSECGAYGGATDEEFYESELNKAKDIASSQFKEVKVTSLFADFEGLHSI